MAYPLAIFMMLTAVPPDQERPCGPPVQLDLALSGVIPLADHLGLYLGERGYGNWHESKYFNGSATAGPVFRSDRFSLAPLIGQGGMYGRDSLALSLLGDAFFFDHELEVAVAEDYLPRLGSAYGRLRVDYDCFISAYSPGQVLPTCRRMTDQDGGFALGLQAGHEDRLVRAGPHVDMFVGIFRLGLAYQLGVIARRYVGEFEVTTALDLTHIDWFWK